VIASASPQCEPFPPEAELATPTADIRSLHLVDAENLLGRTEFNETDVAAAAVAYRAVAGVAETDLVVIASSHYTAFPVWFGWGKARRLVRSGPDGADLALIEVIETENVATRFDRIVIGSGDGIFALPAADLQAVGADVTVVSRRAFLSNRLRLAVRDIRFLDLEPELRPRVALRAA
jgi:hypothetical protein